MNLLAHDARRVAVLKQSELPTKGKVHFAASDLATWRHLRSPKTFRT